MTALRGEVVVDCYTGEIWVVGVVGWGCQEGVLLFERVSQCGRTGRKCDDLDCEEQHSITLRLCLRWFIKRAIGIHTSLRNMDAVWNVLPPFRLQHHVSILSASLRFWTYISFLEYFMYMYILAIHTMTNYIIYWVPDYLESDGAA